MKDFNLQVNWNESEEKYDITMDIKEHSLGEIIETMKNMIVYAFDNICDDKYDSTTASTTTALLIGKEVDELYGDIFTLEQKQNIISDAQKLFEVIGGEN